MDKNLRIYTEKRIGKKNYFENFTHKFSVTTWLIIINVAIFILVNLILIPFIGEDKVDAFLALQAAGFFSGKIWTLFTSMFIHANIEHILANMISLFFLGNFVEKLIGRKRYFWLFIIGGVFAGLFYVSLSYLFGSATLVLGSGAFNIGEKIFSSPVTYAVGASGAIFALAGLLAVLIPRSKVYLIAGPLIAIIFDAIFASAFPSSPYATAVDLVVTFYFIIALFFMFSFNPKTRIIALPIEMPFWILPIVAIVPLVIIGLFVPLPIGNTAHLGGLIVGLVYGAYIRNKYQHKTAMISRMFRK